MSTECLLYRHEVPVSDSINIRIPYVGEILERESEYYSQVSILTSMPIDMCVMLDDIGEDFTKINDYELFLMLFPVLQTQDTSMIFGELDLSGFAIALDEETGSVIYVDAENGIEINRTVYTNIANTLRKIHGLEKNKRSPANETAKQYMIEKERKRLRRNKHKAYESHLENLIVALVNTEQFPYRFDEVPDLTIYQFNESVKQIVHKIDFDNKMRGVYAGTISAKDMSPDELNWLEHK